MAKWHWSRKKDQQKAGGEHSPRPQLSALGRPVTEGTLVQVVEMLIAREDRKELARRRAHMRSQAAKWIFALLLSILLVVLFLGGGSRSDPTPVRVAQEPIRTIALAGKKGTAHVAFIPITGDIGGDKYGSPGLENTEWYVQSALALAEKQSNLSAVILSITSYGGDAVASAHGYRIIKKFRERTKIPVIAFISNYSYSGGYYLSLGANEIIIDPDANLGSVGVIMSWFNTAAIGKVFGVGEVKIATGPLKSCIGQWVELTPACRAGFSRSIDVAFKRFLAAMADSRKIPLETLIKESQSNTGRSNGGTFAAIDAVSRKMADRIEDDDQLFERIAANITKEHPEYESVEFVQYDMKLGLLSGLTGSARQTLESAARLMDALSQLANSSRTRVRAE